MVTKAKKKKSDPVQENERFLTEVRQMLAASTSVYNAKLMLLEVEGLQATMPVTFESRVLIAQIKEKAGLWDSTADEWTALYALEPNNNIVVRYLIRVFIRNSQTDKAMSVIDNTYPSYSTEPSILLQRATSMDDAKLYERSDLLFRNLISKYPNEQKIHIEFAKRLRKRGQFSEALDVLSDVKSLLQTGSTAIVLFESLKREVDALLVSDKTRDLTGLDGRIVAMEYVVSHFVARKLSLSPAKKKIAMITGSLGAGGAERQLSKLAALVSSHKDASALAENSIEVIVKSCSSNNTDFFLPLLEEHDVPVSQINDFKPVWANNQDGIDPLLHDLLSMMPPQVHYGVTRLVPYLKSQRFNVVSLWQDGTILFSAVAALLAGVRNIQLVFRGLPPNIRAARNKPEYLVLYRQLARVPGVSFICNSQIVAMEYSNWLEIPAERFDILYNGVAASSTKPSPSEENRWDSFVKQTDGASETIGGVFRLEPDKQPLRWIKMAGMYLKSRPKARFVIVGNGRLRSTCEELIERLGIKNRVLLVGHSQSVAFWYSNMDVKVLLSRYEGLPNVLIEAQLEGVPVVTTPAGGASECIIKGVTGQLLNCAKEPNLADACEFIKKFVDSYKDNEKARIEAINFVKDNFSERRSLTKFLEICNR